MTDEQTFGAMVAAIRREKNLKQSKLAELVTKIHEPQVGGSTISRLEQGAIPISTALGLGIIDALNPTPSQRRQLEQALDDYIDEFSLPAPYESGLVLDRIMKKIGMTNLDLATRISKSHQLIQAVRAGVKLLSDDALVAIIKELRSQGATSAQIKELMRQHAVDVIMNMPRLTYLSPAQRKKLADCAARIL